MKHWYAVHCKPQQDARAEAHLLNQRFEVFRPKCITKRRRGGRLARAVESLFPRYLFIRLDDIAQSWAPIRSTRGVTGLVRWGGRVPTVPDAVVDGLKARASDDDCVAIGDAGGFRPNERLRITEGPFANLEGLFQARKGEDRVILLLEIIQHAQRLELPETAVARA